MTRRDIALYKLANFSQKMQKRADAGGYWGNIKDNVGALGLLGLAGLWGGRMFGGENKGKRGLLGMISLPSLYALYLAGKKDGGLLNGYGYDGLSWIDRPMGALNAAVNAGYKSWKDSAPPQQASASVEGGPSAS